MALNILIFEGNLGKDPELKKDVNGNPFCTFTMAQTIKRKVKGEEKEFKQWAEVTVWGKASESHSKNLHKGRHVVVNGSMSIEDWTDKEGKARHTLKINALQVNYLDLPEQRGNGQAAREPVEQTEDKAPAGTNSASYYDQHEVETPLQAEPQPGPKAPW